MNKTYTVRLTDDERQELIQLTKSGTAAAYKIKHAHLLLHVDANGPNWSEAQVATAALVPFDVRHARTILLDDAAV